MIFRTGYHWLPPKVTGGPGGHGIVQGPQPQAPQDGRVEVHQDVGFTAALNAFAAGEAREGAGGRQLVGISQVNLEKPWFGNVWCLARKIMGNMEV